MSTPRVQQMSIDRLHITTKTIPAIHANRKPTVFIIAEELAQPLLDTSIPATTPAR